MKNSQPFKRNYQLELVLVHVVGSHHHYKHPNKPGRVTVPHPKKNLRKQTLLSICRQAGWNGWDPNWRKRKKSTRGVLCIGITLL
ncbi:type II toxin-antitoxin system HicA family toxin [Candidatus Poribacteria bacterium]|nr:type II toxin-antitoxin system HicA family toxin [Candidatus Poribacteria bacterium]